MTRTIAQEQVEYRYFVGIEEPPAGWMNPGFNDTLWQNGTYSIGYGDDDDSTLIEPATTVYLRYPLEIPIDYLSQVQALVLLTDFDDGYIAYLNGNEIVRVNVDPSIEYPGFQQTSSRSHEAINYTGIFRTLNGYYIDSLKLATSSLDTTNVLAVQLFNDSINGSDLTFDLAYDFIDNYYSYNLYWNECRFTNPLEIDSLELPIIIIETDEFAFSFRDERVANMGIINNGPGNYNRVDDPYTDYDGLIKINQRGQTSLDFPKVSFRLETQDSLGENNNVALLGMPEENDWILYGPFSDKSLIRNEIVFNLGRKMGYYEPRTRFCELLLNGRDMGLYVLTEKIKRDKNRVAVAELNPDENDSLDVTGGYLFRYDKLYDGRIEIFYPKMDEITSAQSQYIEDYIANSEEAIAGENFSDPVTGYRHYLDDLSLIDYIIVNELTKNIDAYFYSCYMYKDRDDRDGRIKYGPLWDYDFSLGYSIWSDLETSGWQFEERSYLSLSRILQDTSFVNDLAGRWQSLRNGFLNTDSMNSMIDSTAEVLGPFIDRNYQIWPIIQYGYLNPFLENTGQTYSEEIGKLKSWIEERALWIDDHIAGIYYPVIPPVTISFSDNLQKETFFCYPNPCTDYINLRVTLNNPGIVSFEIRDMTGRICAPVSKEEINEKVGDIQLALESTMPPGVYFVYAYRDKNLFAFQRISKVR